MFDLWMGGTIAGTLIATGCTIGGKISAQKRQEQQFQDLCNDMTNRFCETYDLDNGFDTGKDPQ